MDAMIRIDENKFWSKVAKTDNCWNWMGAKHSKGWGIFIQDKHSFLSHRIAYELNFGKIGRIQILHSCHNLACVNPNHIYIKKQEISLTKICSECNREKTLDEFYKEKHHKFGVRNNCKECQNRKSTIRNKLKSKLHRKNCEVCNNEFEGFDYYRYCCIKCKRKADKIRYKDYNKNYFTKRYRIKRKIAGNHEDYDKVTDEAKRNEKGQFIKGSKGTAGKHWKVADTSRVGKSNIGGTNGFKKGNKLKLGKPGYWKGKKRSLEFRLHMREQMKGENAPGWKGGRKPLKTKIRQCFKYREWRKLIFERDNFTCVLCRNKSSIGNRVYLEADHHPVTFSEIFNKNNITNIEQALLTIDFWDINNGRTLCNPCHLKTDTHGSNRKKMKHTSQ